MTDSRELAHADPGSRNVEAAPVDRFSQTIQMVREAMLNPEVDADKAKAMADLMISLEDRALKAEFNRAKNAAVMEMPVITKSGIILMRDKNNPNAAPREQGRFAKFEDIDRVCRPILERHGLALTFDIQGLQGGGLTVTPILTHRNGYTERGGAFPVPAEGSGSKNNAQAMGSSASYGKRYAYCAMLNIITEGVDDDGNRGRGVTVLLPFEREQLVLEEATAAASAGRYQEWFTEQSPKDRGWLVASGKHAEFGGQPAIPAQKREPDVVLTPESTGAPASTGTPAKPKAQTPRQWVEALKGDVGRCAKLDDLDLYMDDARESLDKLKAKDEALWQECQDAFRARRAALEEGRLV